MARYTLLLKQVQTHITTIGSTVAKQPVPPPDPMAALNNIDGLLIQLQQHAATIGITLAGLMIGIYAMLIMLTGERSTKGFSNKWDSLQTVLICAGIIAGTGTFVQFAKGLGAAINIPA